MKGSIVTAHRRLIAGEKRLIEELMILERELAARKDGLSRCPPVVDVQGRSPASARLREKKA
jgi:hypothetical protein